MSTSEMAKQPDGSTGFWGTPGEMGVQGVYLARRARSSVPRVQERAAVTVCITDGNYCHSLTGSNSPSRAFVQKAREPPKHPKGPEMAIERVTSGARDPGRVSQRSRSGSTEHARRSRWTLFHQTSPMSGRRTLAEVDGRIVCGSEDKVRDPAFGLAKGSNVLSDQNFGSAVQHGPEQSVGISFDLSNVRAGAGFIIHSTPTSLRAILCKSLSKSEPYHREVTDPIRIELSPHLSHAVAMIPIGMSDWGGIDLSGVNRSLTVRMPSNKSTTLLRLLPDSSDHRSTPLVTLIVGVGAPRANHRGQR
jgi:hypothetical protein